MGMENTGKTFQAESQLCFGIDFILRKIKSAEESAKEPLPCTMQLFAAVVEEKVVTEDAITAEQTQNLNHDEIMLRIGNKIDAQKLNG